MARAPTKKPSAARKKQRGGTSSASAHTRSAAAKAKPKTKTKAKAEAEVKAKIARPGPPGRAALPKGSAQSGKKKRPAGVKSAGRAQPEKGAKPARPLPGGRARKVSPKKRKAVKAQPAKPVKRPKAKPPRTPKRSPAVTPHKKQPARPTPKRPTKAEHARELARRRKADRARREEQRRAEALEKRRRKWKRKRRKSGGAPSSPAIGWLRRVLTHCREVFPCEMESTFAGGGFADDAAPDPEVVEQSKHTMWLAVGKYTPEEAIGYAQLGEAFARVEGDLMLEADVHPDRMTQIRIIFADPKSKRGEGDAVVSKVGGWQFVWSDLLGELVGASVDSPDEDSLAGRYDETTVPHFYVFIGEQTINYKSAWGGRARAQEMKVR